MGWGGVGQAARTGVAGRVEPSGTVTEVWPVWSYAPTPSAYATAARVCDRVFPNRVDERASEKRVPHFLFNILGRCCCPVAFSASDSHDALLFCLTFLFSQQLVHLDWLACTVTHSSTTVLTE